MRRAFLALGVACLSASAAGGSLAACSSSGNGSTPLDAGHPGDASNASTDAAVDAGKGTFLPELPCTDSITSVYGDPGDVSALANGAIIKCAKDQDLSIAQMNAALDVTDDAGAADYNIAYNGKPLTSAAHVYRILYRTVRGDPGSTPGYSSALLFLPATPRLGAGTSLPAIVASHGSRGQAGKCAPSLNDPAAGDVEEDFQHQVYPLVGSGYAVIAPDLAGYANFGAPGNPPPVYDDALDVGRSVLDGARAIRKVIPSSLTAQTVLTGHSQGGFTTMASLAIASSYAPDVTISAVAVYSPLWISQRAWGAILFEPQTYPFTGSAAGPVSIWYHYTHSYLLDGPDAALELFDPTKAAVVQGFINNDCWSASYPDLEAAGSSANDIFSQTYVSAIAQAAVPVLDNGNCNGNALCQTWIDRMTADYPHLSAAAATVPILLYYANNDMTITPDSMQCVFNRLTSDNANYQVCYDPNPVGHGGVVAENSSYVSDWIAEKTLDAGPPPAGNCTALANNASGVPQLLTADGGAWPCNPDISTQ